MLVGQNCCRNEHSHLLAVAGSLERCAHGNLCLAETHIAAHQTVHGLCLLHVGLHVLCGAQLVGRVFVEETCLQLVLHVAVGAECETLLPAARGIETNEVAGDILDVLLRALLQPLPLASAESGEAWRLAAVLPLVF